MKIGVCAPANRLDPAKAAKVSALVSRDYPGVDLVVHPQCFLDDGAHFAGPDDARAAAFLELANDPGIDAIWFARGGYGSNRILHTVLPQLTDAARRKTYLGYSDIGFVLGALYAAKIGHPVHGPMVSDIARGGGAAAVARSLDWLVKKDRQGFEPGLDDRPAAAFNLSILTTLIGTPWLPDLTDHVLIVEEVSEALYRVDRMLFQLAHATQLKGIAGVRMGRVTDIQPNVPAWRGDVDTMIRRWCAEGGFAYLGPADIAHDAANKIVPFGIA
ncbi:MAG: LD-carboxypeptidase [Pseudomonadota bacterium]|nr:LD-carboxypeptidase [Pseudomonadota bacterium]